MAASSRGKCPKRGGGGERRKRTVFSKMQLAILTQVFKEQRYPNYVQRENLALLTGIAEPRIHVWFQNKRAREPPESRASATDGGSQEVLPQNPCPWQQPTRIQGDAPTRRLLNIIPADSTQWNGIRVPWRNPCHQGASINYPNTPFETGQMALFPQNNTISTSTQPGLEGTGNLPVTHQLDQEGVHYMNSVPSKPHTDANLAWTLEHLSRQSPVPNSQYQVSSMNLPVVENGLHSSHAAGKEGSVQASQASNNHFLQYNGELQVKRESMSVVSGSYSSHTAPSSLVQRLEDSQEASPPIQFQYSLQGTTQCEANWPGVANGLARNSLELVLTNEQQSDSVGSCFPYMEQLYLKYQ